MEIKQTKKHVGDGNNAGFSLAELLISMTIMLLLLGLVSALFARAIGIRSRESRRTDALTSAQAALGVMSREIANSGYGIIYASATSANTPSNGIITADSNARRIHFRANITNENGETSSPGEDVTYFFDSATDSIVRYDPRGDVTKSPAEPLTSVVVNRISDVKFGYFDYSGSSSTPTPNDQIGASTPTVNTGRVRITITVQLDPVQGQPNANVNFTTDVTLRNSDYMLNQY